jgi:hypothetical protein
MSYCDANRLPLLPRKFIPFGSRKSFLLKPQPSKLVLDFRPFIDLASGFRKELLIFLSQPTSGGFFIYM